MSEIKIRAGIFNRNSKGRGGRIEDQDRINRVACKELNADVTVVIEEGVSASRFGTKERKEWAKIVELVRTGQIDLLVLWELQRADRIMDTYVPFLTSCRDNGVRIYVSKEHVLWDPRISAHRTALLDAGIRAEAETEEISARTKDGIASAVLNGKMHGKAAYGYTREYGPIVDGKRTFTEVPNENAKIVVEIVIRLSKRESVKAVTDDLNARKIAAPNGGKWHRSAVRVVATNTTYLGMRKHNGQEHQGNWPPITPDPSWPDTFIACGNVLAENVPAGPQTAAHAPTPRPGAQVHLLSYLLACGKCGSTMSVEPSRDGRLQRYRCAAHGHLSIPTVDADTVVGTLVCTRLARDDARHLWDPDSDAEAAARANLARLEAKVEDNKKAYEDDRVDADAYGRKRRKLEPQVAEAKKELNELSKRSEIRRLLGDGEYTLETVLPKWNALPVPAKRKIIRELMVKVSTVETTVRFCRWTTEEQRLDVAADRIAVEWVA